MTTNGALVDATCTGRGAQAGLTGTARFNLQDRSSVAGAGADSLYFSVTGDLNFSASATATASTLLITPVDPTTGGGTF